MTQNTETHPFDAATDKNKEVNKMLADTDGAISAMAYTGAIGYHINVATGETDPEYLWKVALLQALDETVFEMMYVDQQHPADAKHEVKRELERHMDPFAAENVADLFEEMLTGLIESQEELADETENVRESDQ